MAEPKGSTPGKCPICDRPADQDFRPFCSRRCADIDLSRWLRGAYAIPGETVENRSGGTEPETPPDGSQRKDH